MNLQNSIFEISALLMMSETQKGHLGLILKNWSDWNFKNLTEFSLENLNLNLKFQSNN